MVRITYMGSSNGGWIGFGADGPDRESLSLAKHVLGGSMPTRRSVQYYYGLEFDADGEITEQQADELRRVFALANKIYDDTQDTAAAWRAIYAATHDPA